MKTSAPPCSQCRESEEACRRLAALLSYIDMDPRILLRLVCDGLPGLYLDFMRLFNAYQRLRKGLGLELLTASLEEGE
ncbi:hypothetical protein [Pyrodictium occultum]|uniref:hypothetical protein n=1 Tax=Pyrodictium occultum TaxID=2309 RepID=UPI00071E9509|nr:hypothetical protein [Pyrodictium occultum]